MRNFKDSVTGKGSDDDPEPAEIEAPKVDAAADKRRRAQSTPAGDAPS